VNPTLLHRLLRLGLVLGCATVGQAALAATVVLVRPAHPGGVASEALVRVHGELVSAGFDVEFATAAAGADAHVSLHKFASGREVDAVVAILGDEAPDSIEVWVVDKLTGKALTRHSPYQPEGEERAAEVLAIRAIELLRASLLEVDMAAVAPAPAAPEPAPVVVTRFIDRAVEARVDSRWGLQVGASLVTSFDGVGPAVLPLFRLDRVINTWCLAQATLAGLGTRSHVGSAVMTAQVAEQFALVGASLRFRSSERVRPVLSLGAGLLHTSVEGRGDWPYVGKTAAQWSFLLDAGIGARVAVGNRYEVVIETHVQLTEPHPVVQFLGADVASSGLPSLNLTLTLVAWL
jgi:hypothetical protein